MRDATGTTRAGGAVRGMVRADTRRGVHAGGSGRGRPGGDTDHCMVSMLLSGHGCCHPSPRPPVENRGTLGNMPERLTAQETAIWAAEVAGLPAHIGQVNVFDLPADHVLDFTRMESLIAERLAIVPRYRQRVRVVPAGIAPPVWVDDDHFDLSFHIRRSALPRPGTHQQLTEFVARVMARELDRDRPLWEAYLVEGLTGEEGQPQFALVVKSHLLLINGIGDVSLDQVIFDDVPDEEPSADTSWHPAPGPSGMQLFVDAVLGAVADPVGAATAIGQQATVVAGAVVEWGESLGAVPSGLADLAAAALRREDTSPLTGPVGAQRRFATADISLDTLRGLAEAHQTSVNDVVLAVIAGALRAWLTCRGDDEPADVRAVVPMSVPDSDGEPTALGCRVAPHVMTLPIQEANPVMRLHQISYGTSGHTDTGRFVGARQLVDIAGFAPGTLHALGVRESRRIMRRQHDLVVTNAPGPQHRLYGAGSQLVASWPVLPLTSGHLLAIGITSYDRRVHIGFTADRDRVADVDQLAGFVSEAVRELIITDAEATAWAGHQEGEAST